MKKIIILLCIFLNINNHLLAINFAPLHNCSYLERNYEIFNSFYAYSIKNNQMIISDIIANIYYKFIKDNNINIHDERYLVRLGLFLVNIAHKYDIENEILEKLKNTDKKNKHEIIQYAKNLYLMYSKDSKELFQSAEIAFDENISVDDLNNICFDGAYGVDIVYKNNNIINHHLINMIMFKIIEKSPNEIITSLSLKIQLPAHIWLKLIIADQRSKMLIFKNDFVSYIPYDPQVIIEDLFDKNNYSSIEKFNIIMNNDKEKINQLFNSVFLFAEQDFEIIKKSFAIIKNIDDLKKFNKQEHFFIFRYIAKKNKQNNNRYSLLNYITENIIKNDPINFNSTTFGLNSLLEKLHSIENNNFNNEEIKKEIMKEQQDSMYEILYKKYFYHEEINKHVLQIEYDNFLLKNDLNNNYDDHFMKFKNKIPNKLTITDILRKKSKHNEQFKEQIITIFNALKENLSNKQLEIYNKFNNISFKYDDFKDIKIVDYQHTTSLTYKKIKNRLFNNEILKVNIIKLIKNNIINKLSKEEDIFNAIFNNTKITLNDKKISLFNEECNINLSDINNIKYKTKTKNFSGIDVFIFNPYLREMFLKICYLSHESNYKKLIISNNLKIELSFEQWAILFQTLDKKTNNSQLTEFIFNEIKNKYNNIESFIEYDNKQPFFDNYLMNINKKSMRENLFKYYIYNEYKDIVNNIKIENNNNILSDKLNEFLKKINYTHKALIDTKKEEEILREQDKSIVEDYLLDLLDKKNQVNYKKKKNEPKKRPAKKEVAKKAVKKTENKKEKQIVQEQGNKESNTKITRTNKNNKKSQKKPGGFIADKTLHKNTKKTNEALKERKILISKPVSETAINLSKYKCLLNKVIVPQLNSDFRDLQYKLNDKYENTQKQEKVEENNIVISLLNSNEKLIGIEQKNKLSPVQNITTIPLFPKVEEELTVPVKQEVKAEKEQADKKHVRLKPKNIVKNTISAAKRVFLGDFSSYVANFFSPIQINRMQTEHKKFIANSSKDKEKYAEMIKEISKNYCNNIFALDEFISILINEKNNEDIDYFNIKLSEVYMCINNISLNQDNKNVNNLVEQICNNFKYLNENEANFIQLIYSSSHYQDLVYSFMQVDGSVSEKDFSDLLLWGTAHIKQKNLLSDRVLAYKNQRKMYYDYIIFSYEKLREILN